MQSMRSAKPAAKGFGMSDCFRDGSLVGVWDVGLSKVL